MSFQTQNDTYIGNFEMRCKLASQTSCIAFKENLAEYFNNRFFDFLASVTNMEIYEDNTCKIWVRVERPFQNLALFATYLGNPFLGAMREKFQFLANMHFGISEQIEWMDFSFTIDNVLKHTGYHADQFETQFFEEVQLEIAAPQQYMLTGIGSSMNIYESKIKTVPDIPTDVLANPGPDISGAVVHFEPPTVTGNTPITGYMVTSNPGDVVAIGQRSPIAFTTLVSGQSYTFTVTAMNEIGTGLPSISSNSITIY